MTSFFISKRSAPSIADRYFLRARFRVAEKIDHVDARNRFGPRQNVIIDELPAGPDVRSRVMEYIDQWQHDLQWNDGFPDLAHLASGNWTESEFLVAAAPDQWYVHSYWDPHVDWKNRLRTPYLISDESICRVLSEPPRWADVANRSKHLPSPGELTNKSNRHAAQRVWERSDRELLSGIFA